MAAKPVSPDLAGAPSGHFELGEILGSGGGGTVYQARDTRLNRDVALKVVDGIEAPARARFEREARILANLRSDHVARVFEIGEFPDGRGYIAMERVHGRDLRSLLIQDGAQSAAVIAEYLLGACCGLAEAHAQGIVHRDLKPSNLMVARTPDGPSVKVLDFGVSKTAAVDAGADPVTQTGAVLGTPHYMAPEQIHDPRNADVRSDVWALGVIAYEMATGERPFTAASTTGVAVAIVNEPTPDLSSKLLNVDAAPDVAAAFVRVIQRCLSKDAARRYASMLELGRALSPFTDPRRGDVLVSRLEQLAQPDSGEALATPDPDLPTLTSDTTSAPLDSDTASPTSASVPIAITDKSSRPKRFAAAAAIAAVGVAAFAHLRARPQIEPDNAEASAMSAAPPELAAEPVIAPPRTTSSGSTAQPPGSARAASSIIAAAAARPTSSVSPSTPSKPKPARLATPKPAAPKPAVPPPATARDPYEFRR